ncbi:MAG: GNAT family N-acetyltransferase [Alphaproteobacteria bacterium]|nr:GNAT family N-acetyltransferase [Alphaproteobacteria bacterium]USO07442.1 MAG: GNAT family N-acetyltransferase [Rhodospirillales bacterium]
MPDAATRQPDEFSLAGAGVSMGPIAVRLARTAAEIEAAQKLRYNVFYREYGAKPVGDMEARGLDYDDFDPHADHLIVIDRRIETLPERVIGTYRLLRDNVAVKLGRFYSGGEYDIAPLTGSGAKMVEVGRSCVHPDHRTRNVLQLLWQGIAEYIHWHDIGVLFGVASFHGTDVAAHAAMLSYLHHYHRAPDDFCPRALPDQYVDMNLVQKSAINPREALHDLPPLIKGYLRLGGMVGDGAVIDRQFNTIDVCVIVRTQLVSDRYRRHYQRKVEGFGGGVENIGAHSEII